MADMPTIYPMRFPSVPAQRTPTNIDDLLPSTYMDRPTIFTSAMQNVGKMLGQKQNDQDEAAMAAMKFGPTVDPGQIQALNNYLFRRGGTPYGGVMNPQGTEALQVPGEAPLTPFNTAGLTGAQTNAEQAAALQAKQEAAKAQQELLQHKLDQNQKQFEQRSQQRDAELAEKKANHEHVNARIMNLGNRRLALTADNMNYKRAADAASKQAGQAFSNAKSFASQAAALEKAMATDFTMSPEVKQQRQDELKRLHDQADAEMKRGWDLDASASTYVDRITGNEGAAPPPRPATAQSPATKQRPTRPTGAKWFDASELAGHPEAAAQIPAGKTGGWFKPDGTLDTY
jgi:hypothetical protein